MKIAILTSGRLPVPAVLGGAVENLVDYYLEYNDAHHLIATRVGGISEFAGDCALFVSKSNVVCELKDACTLYTDKTRCMEMASQSLLISKKYGKVRYASEFYLQL